jgi:hypothetical protein
MIYVNGSGFVDDDVDDEIVNIRQTMIETVTVTVIVTGQLSLHLYFREEGRGKERGL